VCVCVPHMSKQMRVCEERRLARKRKWV